MLVGAVFLVFPKFRIVFILIIFREFGLKMREVANKESGVLTRPGLFNGILNGGNFLNVNDFIVLRKVLTFANTDPGYTVRYLQILKTEIKIRVLLHLPASPYWLYCGVIFRATMYYSAIQCLLIH